MPGGMGSTPIRKRAGQRKHHITLQEGTTVEDTLGGESTTQWSAFGQDAAAIDEIPFIVSESEAAILYNVTIKYRSDVVSKFADQIAIRVVSAAQTMKVLQLENPEQRNIELILHCAKG